MLLFVLYVSLKSIFYNNILKNLWTQNKKIAESAPASNQSLITGVFANFRALSF